MICKGGRRTLENNQKKKAAISLCTLLILSGLLGTFFLLSGKKSSDTAKKTESIHADSSNAENNISEKIDGVENEDIGNQNISVAADNIASSKNSSFNNSLSITVKSSTNIAKPSSNSNITSDSANSGKDSNTEQESETTADIADSFMQKAFQTTEAVELKYWLYTPENPTTNMPLIVYLHGGSGKGSDLNTVVKDGFPKYLKNGELGNVNAYVIIPQLPSSYKGWSDIKVSLRDLIVSTKNTYGINPDKISLTGHSMGGKGTYDIALAYPNLFSCIAPMSGSITLNDANINKLKDISVWAFVGSADTIVDPSSSINFINGLKQVNSNVELTIFDGAGHFGVPELGYKSTDVVSWLINKTR